MINRRFMIVPPALLRGGHAEQLEGQARNFCAAILNSVSGQISPRVF
jgi:hypothetical protein